MGASLGIALRALGTTLLGYTADSAAGRARAEGWLGGRAAADLSELVSARPHLFVVAVPDQALPRVAQDLAHEQPVAGIVTPLEAEIRVAGRHDPCVVPRAVPVVEAMVAIVLADQALRRGIIPQVLGEGV